MIAHRPLISRPLLTERGFRLRGGNSRESAKGTIVEAQERNRDRLKPGAKEEKKRTRGESQGSPDKGGRIYHDGKGVLSEGKDIE